MPTRKCSATKRPLLRSRLPWNLTAAGRRTYQRGSLVRDPPPSMHWRDQHAPGLLRIPPELPDHPQGRPATRAHALPRTATALQARPRPFLTLVQQTIDEDHRTAPEQRHTARHIFEFAR